MRKAVRTVFLFLLGLLSAVFLGVAMALTSAISLAATALIVPGTGTPIANLPYMENARDYYMGGTACAGAGCTLTSIEYPASFWPLPFPGWCRSGPDGCDKWNVSVAKGVEDLNEELDAALGIAGEDIVIFGYSQGGQVVSNEMRERLAGLSDDMKRRLQIVMIGNIANPDGGLWPRLSPFSFLGQLLLDATLGPPMITDIGIPTTNIGFEYDPVVYSPKFWGNPLALLNALAAFQNVHGQYLAGPNRPGSGTLPYGYTEAELAAALADPNNVRYGGNDPNSNNKYIMIPAKSLPLADLIVSVADSFGIGPFVKPFVSLLAPIAKVIIDLAYDWSGDPNVPQTLSILPFNPFQNWIEVGLKLVAAAIEGIQAFLGDLGVGATPAPSPAPAPLTTTVSTLESEAEPLAAMSEDATALTESISEDEETTAARTLTVVEDIDATTVVDEATVQETETIPQEDEVTVEQDEVTVEQDEVTIEEDEAAEEGQTTVKEEETVDEATTDPAADEDATDADAKDADAKQTADDAKQTADDDKKVADNDDSNDADNEKAAA
jgi:hypothetical protein